MKFRVIVPALVLVFVFVFVLVLMLVLVCMLALALLFYTLRAKVILVAAIFTLTLR